MQLRLSPLVGRLTLMILALALALPGNAQAPSKRERQLSKRVDQLYQLFVSGEWKKVEPFVAKESQEIWLAQAKGRIDSYRIEEVKVAPDGKQADVTVLATFRMPQAEAPFTQPQKSQWLYEKGRWFIKLRRPPSLLEMFKAASSSTPTGPGLSPLVFDQNPIQIPRPKEGGEAVVQVAFQNVTPDTIALQDLQTTCACLKAEVVGSGLGLAEKGTLTLTYNPSLHSNSERLAVRAMVTPTMYSLEVPVELTGE